MSANVPLTKAESHGRAHSQSMGQSVPPRMARKITWPKECIWEGWRKGALFVIYHNYLTVSYTPSKPSLTSLSFLWRKMLWLFLVDVIIMWENGGDGGGGKCLLWLFGGTVRLIADPPLLRVQPPPRYPHLRRSQNYCYHLSNPCQIICSDDFPNQLPPNK